MGEPVKSLRSWAQANRIRLIVRASFCALVAAAVFLPYVSIKSQKDRSIAEELKNSTSTQQRIVDRLLSAEGQLVLLNPHRITKPPVPLRPVVLPFSDVYANAPTTVFDQFSTAGCPIQFRSPKSQMDQGSICVGVSSRDSEDVQRRLFVAGTFVSKRLVPHVFLKPSRIDVDRPVARSIAGAHHINLDLFDGKQVYRWVLPVQIKFDPKTREPLSEIGLTAFRLDEQGIPLTDKPDFTGAWLTEGSCIQESQPVDTCSRIVTFTIAVPRNKWRDFNQEGRSVNPLDLSIKLTVSGPLDGGKPQILLDSDDSASAVLPFAASDLESHLSPGESLSVSRRSADGQSKKVFAITRSGGSDGRLQSFGELVLKLVPSAPIEQTDNKSTITVRGRQFEIRRANRTQGFDLDLAQNSARMAAYAGFMISAILLAWTVIELGIVRRVLQVTRRARHVSSVVRAEGDLNPLDFSDLRSKDEVGTLASTLHDLLSRIGEDMRKQSIRAKHQSSMVRAIGHEIRSPLQSLLALSDSKASEEARPYIKRMLRAVDALYGSASPSDGINSASIDIEDVELRNFLATLAGNAGLAKVDNVVFDGAPEEVNIRVDPSALADVLSHILNNAARYRPLGTAITIRLEADTKFARVTIHNHGPHIPADLIDRIFEYGVSDRAGGEIGEHGQGLFVAFTYVSRMGGSIFANNLANGVAFVIELPRVSLETID